jgi:SAM-dependent methyltransferase
MSMMTALRDRLPEGTLRQIRRMVRPAWFGTLRRTAPLSRHWGFDRGTPVDRYYIEKFLDGHRRDIRGQVLEVKDNGYTKRFGLAVTRSDVIDIDASNPEATIIADLAAADHVAADQFDCFILTQTLHIIFDIRGALHHSHRLLKPGGVLLATMPVVSRVRTPDYWRFTPQACSRLFGDVFGSENVQVEAPGNVLASIAFLEGLAYRELRARELDEHDEQYPLIVTVRAIKRHAAA